MAHTISAEALTAWATAIVAGTGSSAEEARCVAGNLVMANLSGHDSHGVGMLPRYVDAFLEGGLKPNTAARVVLDTGTLLTLDGQRGYGQVVGEQAMGLALARAQAHGSCIMTLANAHHLGRIGHFGEMAAAQGLVALMFVNVLSRPNVAPFGGADGRFGTNPCCIAIPMKDRPPFILDFATSRVAQGKMRVAYNEGHEVEPGLLICERGLPTTHPGVVVVPQGNGLFGALLAFGEHKGYGLAVACELLGGALTGSGTWHRPGDGKRTVVNGMLAVLINPALLGTQDVFETEALAFVDWLRQGPVAAGFDAVLLAGEPERAQREARGREGIVIDDGTWAELQQAAGKVGVAGQP